MKLLLVFVSVLSFNPIASAVENPIQEKVIYGKDNRKDIFESNNLLYKKLARSTLAMFGVEKLKDNGDSMTILGDSLESKGMCSDIRFVQQITAADCSGFLVGDQYILTAGHCMNTVEECQNYVWLFGFANETKEKSSYTIPKTDIYKCIEITERVATYNDYALLKLDRPVTGREPLKYRTNGKISDTASLIVIGHPSGLPAKIADGANVRKDTNSESWFFQANLDTFSGNSGSAVFDAKTGIVEGILVRGEKDYETDAVKSCDRPYVCKDNDCRGEDVIRVTNVATLMNHAQNTKLFSATTDSGPKSLLHSDKKIPF